MADDFVQQIARLLGQSPEDTHRTLHALADSIRSEVEAEGTAEIEGLGVFRRDGEALAFDPAPALSQAVNHRYAGLPALESGPPETPDPPAAAAPEEAEAEEPVAAPSEPADPFAEEEAADLALPSEPIAEPVRDLTSEPSTEEAEPATEEPFAAAAPEQEEAPAETEAPEPFAPLASSESQLEPEPSFPTEEDEPGAEVVEDPLASELTFLESLDRPEDSRASAEAEPVEFDATPEQKATNEVTLEGEMLGEDAFYHATPEAEPSAEADDEEIDALLEGVWAEAPESSDTDYPLGAMPPDPIEPDPIEDAEHTVVSDTDDMLDRYREADRLVNENVGETDFDLAPDADDALGEPEEEALETTDDVAEDAELVSEEAVADEETVEEDEPLSVLTAGLASEPAAVVAESEADETVSPRAEPKPTGPAPAFAATAAKQDTLDEPTVRETRERSRAPLFIGLAAVVLAALALFWFMGRDADPVAERGDDVVATPPEDSSIDPATPDEPIADAATPETPTPEPEPAAPPPSEDPLRSTAGIDQAEGGFSWVVASEFSRAPAERRVAEFREQGFRADVIAQETGGRTRYRVALGQFDSLDEANRYRSDLPSGVPDDTWVLRF